MKYKHLTSDIVCFILVFTSIMETYYYLLPCNEKRFTKSLRFKRWINLLFCGLYFESYGGFLIAYELLQTTTKVKFSHVSLILWEMHIQTFCTKYKKTHNNYILKAFTHSSLRQITRVSNENSKVFLQESLRSYLLFRRVYAYAKYSSMIQICISYLVMKYIILR